MLPALVAHADWSVIAQKRWVARATLGPEGHYRAHAPEPVGEPKTLLARLAANGCGLVGFDFPIGLPAAYARAAGIERFLDLLARAEAIGVAERPDQISLEWPFYPYRPGGTSRRYLTEALGLEWNDLLRLCDRLSRAGPLFWTLGAKQVGKAALHGWQTVLAPALPAISIWPFDGPLEALLAGGRLVGAETYPAAFYRNLGLRVRRKGSRADRREQAPALVSFAEGAGIELDLALRDAIADGFDSDDEFDAVVGLLGMLEVVLGRRSAGWAGDGVEGWMLGLEP